MQRKPVADYMKPVKNRAKKSAEELAAEEQAKLAQPQSPSSEPQASPAKPPLFSNPPKPVVSAAAAAVTPARKPAVVLQKPPALNLPKGYKPPAQTAAVKPTPSEPATSTPATPTVMKPVEPQSAPKTAAKTSHAIPNRQEMDDVTEKYRELEKSLYNKIVDLHQQINSLCAPNAHTPLPGNEKRFATINTKYNSLCADLEKIRKIETAMGEAKTTDAWLEQFHALSTQVDAISRQQRREATSLDAIAARNAVMAEPKKMIKSASNDLPLEDKSNPLYKVNNDASAINSDISSLLRKLTEYSSPNDNNKSRTYSDNAKALGSKCTDWLARMERIQNDIASNDPAKVLGISNMINEVLKEMKSTLKSEQKNLGLLSFTSQYPDIIKDAIANVEKMQKALSPRQAEAERMKHYCQEGSRDQYTEKRTQGSRASLEKAKKNDTTVKEGSTYTRKIK